MINFDWTWFRTEFSIFRNIATLHFNPQFTWFNRSKRVRRAAVICERHRCLRNLHFSSGGGFRRLRRSGTHRTAAIWLCAIILCPLREYFGSTSTSMCGTKVTGVPLIIENTLSSVQESNWANIPFSHPTGSTFLPASISPRIINHFFGSIKI